jgi:hypothetical protein
MTLSFRLSLSALKSRFDLRCSYCGASLLYGRHYDTRSVFSKPLRPSDLRPFRKTRLLQRRLPAMCGEMTLGAAVLCLGFIFHSSLSAGNSDLSHSYTSLNQQKEVPEIPTAPAVPVQPDEPSKTTLAPTSVSAAASEDPGLDLVPSASNKVDDRLLVGTLAPAPARLVQPAEREADVDVQSGAAHWGGSGASPSLAGVQSILGTWGAHISACSRHSAARTGYLPMIVTSRGARAGGASCVFHDMRQHDGSWTGVARCSSAGERWTSRVQLALSGNRLIWKSERGLQKYVRCNPSS